jgi:hypothetical protein
VQLGQKARGELLGTGHLEDDESLAELRHDVVAKLSSAIAPVGSSTCSSMRSLPTAALSTSGLPVATISPWSMIAIRSQFSASSM